MKCRHTWSPQLAASTMAMQKASVSDVLRKMWPWTRTPQTSLCSKGPSRRTLHQGRTRKMKLLWFHFPSQAALRCGINFFLVQKLRYIINIKQSCQVSFTVWKTAIHFFLINYLGLSPLSYFYFTFNHNIQLKPMTLTFTHRCTQKLQGN